jgi:mannose-6-phosphate isomerase
VLVRIENDARSYAWGSKTLLRDLRGEPAADYPESEIWFGTHPASPARLADTGVSLADTVDPLPFLVKLLAAEQPLSIQAHPSRGRAVKQFAAENQRGLALDAPNRNYRDDNHKPELLIALTDFSALCGFRPLQQTVAEVSSLAVISSGLRPLVAELANGYGPALDWVFQNPQVVATLDPAHCLSRRRARLTEQLLEQHPGDPGVLVSLFLNLVTLAPGEALYLPAGNLHSYLSGLGLEVMAASDNVLRGGLTTKHIDVAELMAVVDHSVLDDPKQRARELSSGITEIIETEDFKVYRLEPSAKNVIADIELASEAIVVCVAGTVSLSTSLDQPLELRAGQAAYVSAEARLFSAAGAGTAYLTVAG